MLSCIVCHPHQLVTPVQTPLRRRCLIESRDAATDPNFRFGTFCYVKHGHLLPGKGLIHHSDRGSQYCAHAYQKLLRQFGMQASMSRKGNCRDNAPMESVSLAETKEHFVSAGMEPLGGSPQETATILKNEMSLWSKVIKDTGINAN